MVRPDEPTLSRQNDEKPTRPYQTPRDNLGLDLASTQTERPPGGHRRSINGKVTMRDPRTGDLKQIKDGFSWTTLIFWDWFGIPLFNRGLVGYGWLGIVYAIISFLFLDAWPLVLTGSILSGIWLGSMANLEQEKLLLRRGWVYE
jgi:hypothetical protein